MERDWAADEKKINILASGYQVSIATDIAKAALAERRRLAGLLTWRPGPPTEPGNYLTWYPDCVDPFFDAWTKESIASFAGHDHLWHLGPLPPPSKMEATNGKS